MLYLPAGDSLSNHNMNPLLINQLARIGAEQTFRILVVSMTNTVEDGAWFLLHQASQAGQGLLSSAVLSGSLEMVKTVRLVSPYCKT